MKRRGTTGRKLVPWIALTAGSLAHAEPSAVAPPAACPSCGPSQDSLEPTATLRWQTQRLGPGIRGLTLGPIESALHPGVGYGSAACARAMRDARRLGASWVSLTPFGRIWDLHPTGVDLTFEASYRSNRRALARAIQQAHAAGLKVLLVPHLWSETGEWRGHINPGEQGWDRWARAYQHFVLEWARLAAEQDVDLFSVGVELRSWVTGVHAPSFRQVISAVRRVYAGPLTYAANWDDVHDTLVLGDLDVIGVNAFYPLTETPGATLEQLLTGSRQRRDLLRRLASDWHKPILFTEMGYTARDDTALRPWEWPEHLGTVRVNETAQAEAYYALLQPLLDEPWFQGFFVWRLFSDPQDVSQEQDWGFSPRGKQAELILRDAFAAPWAVDDQGLGHWAARAGGANLGNRWP